MTNKDITPFKEDTTFSYLIPFRKRTYHIYTFILLLFIAAILILPFVSTTISVNVQGITRPEHERTTVKNIIAGVIDKIYYKEGENIQRNAIILRIKDKISASKRVKNNYEINQRKLFIHDLQLLTVDSLGVHLLRHLHSPLYKEQLNRYLTAIEEQQADLRKAAKELSINQKLVDEKVIAPKEFFDTQVAYDKALAAANSLERNQRSNWQQDLIKYNLELSEYEELLSQVNSDASYYDVKAPIGGTVQDINTLYPGGGLQAGETICTISPNDSLIGECLKIVGKHPEAKRITLVMGNFKRHSLTALYETFKPDEAKRLWDRFEFIYTPKNGSWLHMAEIELHVLNEQYLSRLIASFEELGCEGNYWQHARNNRNAKIKWQFTTKEAQIKLRRLYPSLYY